MTGGVGRCAGERLLVVARAVALAWCGMSATGCASSEGVTRGWGMELRVSDPPKNRFVFYSLARDGTVTYIGGRNAMRTEPGVSEKATYRGKVTGSEVDGLVRALEGAERIEGVEVKDGEAQYTLAVQPPGKMGRRVRSAETAELKRVLEEAARLVDQKRGGAGTAE